MTNDTDNDPIDKNEDDRVGELLEQFQPAKIPYSRRVFANRNLRMSAIELVGFDMDYTLAQYHTTLEELSIRMTMERMVDRLGYDKRILDFDYDSRFAIRGLAIDKRNGNIIKMDSHRHISLAFHGTKEIEKEERRALYRHERIRMSAERYSLIDTLFAVPEAWLFAHIVELKERDRKKPLPKKEYKKIYKDIRSIIDTVHADQTMKKIVMADLATYIVKDTELATMLHRLRGAGKRLFLMTNSYGPYTMAVMTYLLDNALPEYANWQDYFDIIVVGARKPTFFAQGTELFQLDDNLEPMTKKVTEFEQGQIYQGGCIQDFESMAGTSGDKILYVGDHLYGDILRSKKATTWRTAMIVPEMERELSIREDLADEFIRRNELNTHRTQIDRELSQQKQLIHSMAEFSEDRAGEFSQEERLAFRHAFRVARKNVRKLERALRRCLAQVWKLNNHIEHSFNPNWGMLFKARSEHSLFGSQVEDYACIYTSRASNLGLYSPFQYYRTPHDLMSHEHIGPDIGQ